MIYTTYFAKLRKLPKHIIPVAICGKMPAGYTGLQYKQLAPRFDFFTEWKVTGDNDYFVRSYNDIVLGSLSQSFVVDTLKSMTGSEDIALVCYEKSTDFCHRHLVADWLRAAGIQVEEFQE